MWVATDGDGKKHGYKNKSPFMTAWTNFWHYKRDCDFIEIGLTSEYKGDWRDSLEQRP